MKNLLSASVILLSSMAVVSADETEDYSAHVHGPSKESGGFLAPFEHLHFSRLGSPIVHSFGVEPAYTGRDLFVDYRFRSGDEPTVQEFNFELEWAFTRRLGVIVEAPYVFDNEEGEGFGNLAVVPRAILLEKDRFILTSQVEIVTPTAASGIGGETAIAPGLASWLDLGDWWTLNSQVAVEHIFDEDVTEFLFGLGLVKTIRLSNHAPDDSHGHISAAGLLNLHLEVTGSVGLSGEDEGAVNAEGLLGVSYGVSSHLDFRVGYEFPLSSPNDFNGGLVTGFIWHF